MNALWIMKWIYCVSQKQMFWPSLNFFQCFQNRVCLTSSILSSSISLNTVSLIWLGFSATQLNTGIRNLVLMGFLIFTATHMTESTSQQPHASYTNTKHAVWVTWSWFVNSRHKSESAHLWGNMRGNVWTWDLWYCQH